MNVVEDVLRAGCFAGLVLLCGVGGYWLYLWPEGRWSRSVTKLAWTGWVVTAVLTVALLWIGLAGSGRGLRGSLATASVSSLVLRLALLCLAAPWLQEVERTYGGLRYRGMDSAKSLAGGAVLVLMPLTFAVGSGSATGRWDGLRMVLNVVRAGGLAVWLGALVVLAAIVVPRNDQSEVGTALVRFTTVAAVAVGVSAASVLVSAFARPGGVGELLHSRHGAVAGAEVLVLVGLAWFGDRTLRDARRMLEYVRRTGGRTLVRRGVVRTELVVAGAIVLAASALFVVPT
ncbi:MAG: hypothetical protein ABI429_05285 [Jatrophihabitantaceae bacterium]